jgi:phosphate uptake regulator
MTEYTTRVDHTAKAFDTDLQEITRKVAEMGGLAERQIADSVRRWSIATSNWERVIAMDPTIDAMQREIEEKAILTIARRQPMAVDLRESSAPCASATISSASATTPSISASAWSRSTATSIRKS